MKTNYETPEEEAIYGYLDYPQKTKKVALKRSKKPKKPKIKYLGYILYEGKSMINGKPIVGLLKTTKSDNAKTGDMLQLYILSNEAKPTEAQKLGLDESICGDCKHRHFLNGGCYVNVGQGANSMYNAYKRGRYTPIESYAELAGKKIRFGAYGDPFALPDYLLDKLSSMSLANTSYTHQPRLAPESFKAHTMASADSLEEKREFNADGWRTFRTVVPDDEGNVELDHDEILCPSYTNGTQCTDCLLCAGTSVQAKNIAMPVHGTWKGRFKK